MKNKKILHVIATANPEYGGPIEGIKQLQKGLTKSRVEVEVLCTDRQSSKWIADFPFKIYCLGPSVLNYRYSVDIKYWIKKNHHKYDLIIVNGIWQYTSFAIWQILKRTNKPYIIFPHGMLDPWFKFEYPIKHLKKLVYWRFIENKVLRDAKYVCFTCEEERILAKKTFSPYKVKEFVTGYGINPPPSNSKRLRNEFISKYPELENKKIIFYISRLHEKKGCDLLISAFAKISKSDETLHLVISGPDTDNMRIKLEKLVSEKLISERVTWTGMLVGDEKWGAFYSADVFCLPSHQENFGIVVAESLACGLPVLISNKVNIWREVQRSCAGFVNDDDEEGTIMNLENWIMLSQESKQKMRQAATQCYESFFSMDNYLKNIIQILEKNTDLKIELVE